MLRHAPWLYALRRRFFYVFFVTHDRKNQKNCFDFDDDALRWSQSPTSTTDAILGRFLQMTARWKALIELEPVRLLTGWLLWLHGFGLGMVGRFRADHQGSRRVSGSFFVANQVAWP